MSEYAQKYKAATDQFLDLIKILKPVDLDNTNSESWSPRQIIHHLADSEAQSYARLRRLIAEPGTIIQGYDEGKWAENKTLGYEIGAVTSSIAVFKSVRESSYELIIRLSEKELDNFGEHTELGRYTVIDWLNSYINHPINHANQIRNQI